MKPTQVMNGKYQSGQATCVLQRPASLPVSMRDGIRELTKLHTPIAHRNKGEASQLLREVCEEADRQGIVLMLMPEPFDEPDLGATQLEHWYARFGFMTIQAEPKLMARMVGATPRLLNPVTAAVGRAIEAF
jgi:hypothetical protein